MTTTLHYVFDPLCGWCYGAGGTVAALAQIPAVQLHLLPSGLFSGKGSRPMDQDLAQYAWSNDQRIARLTGQSFTERYRSKVLTDFQQRFDSGPATLALTAVAMAAPERQVEALEAIQQARYIEGSNITDVHQLTEVLNDLGLTQAAQILQAPDDAFFAANATRITQAQAMMQEFHVRGVPSFILEIDGKRQLLASDAVYANPRAFIEQIEQTLKAA